MLGTKERNGLVEGDSLILSLREKNKHWVKVVD